MRSIQRQDEFFQFSIFSSTGHLGWQSENINLNKPSNKISGQRKPPTSIYDRNTGFFWQQLVYIGGRESGLLTNKKIQDSVKSFDQGVVWSATTRPLQLYSDTRLLQPPSSPDGVHTQALRGTLQREHPADFVFVPCACFQIVGEQVQCVYITQSPVPFHQFKWTFSAVDGGPKWS